MTPTFTDQQRVIQLTTPLGANQLIATGFQGREAISELFAFQIDTATESQDPIAFDKLIGQSVTVKFEMIAGTRYFNGIVTGILQGAREEVNTHYRLKISPKLWTLTRNAQSRIFQQMKVPDILKQVFTGLDVDYQLTGTYKEREYCVQYRETDFNFASRLMEEEGIFYFFKHTDGAHTLVLGDTPQAFADLTVSPTVAYDPAITADEFTNSISRWEKVQDWRSGKTTLWDYEFQMPDKNCEGVATGLESLQAGTVTHKLIVNGNNAFELYDYPGNYGKRFDGISTGGGDQSSNLQDIFEDNTRTAKIRMAQETARGFDIRGESVHGGFTSGYNITLQAHFSDDGEYTLTAVEHTARQPLGDQTPFHYTNTFHAIPAALPFSPARTTPEPFVHGPQTAKVVGPSGEEIFTDKYGRVKVQFHWDRKGQNDSSSSCWLRVGTHWGGKQWGAIHIPRMGQEVIVAFLEGDPDQPIIVGSVYNADNMPPWTLPDNKTQSGIKSQSSKGGSTSNFNQIRFEDKMGSEEVNVQAEKDMNTLIKHDETRHVQNNRTTNIDVDETKTVKGKETTTVTGNQTTEITQGNQSNTVDMGNQSNELKMGNQTVKLDMGNQSTTLSMGNQSTTLDMGNISTNCSLGSISMQAMQSITLTVGPNSIEISMMGVKINGVMVTVQADAICQIQGALTTIN